MRHVWNFGSFICTSSIDFLCHCPLACIGEDVEMSCCGASFGTVFAEALDSLSEEAEPLGLRVSWMKTKVQAFGDILDATVESIPVNGENVEVTQTFTYLGSDGVNNDYQDYQDYSGDPLLFTTAITLFFPFSTTTVTPVTGTRIAVGNMNPPHIRQQPPARCIADVGVTARRSEHNLDVLPAARGGFHDVRTGTCP